MAIVKIIKDINTGDIQGEDSNDCRSSRLKMVVVLNPDERKGSWGMARLSHNELRIMETRLLGRK